MTAMAYDWRGPWTAQTRCPPMSRGRHRHGHAGFGPGGFGGSGFGPPFGPRGRRAARGDVRAAVLVLLAEEPRNGYALMQEIEQRSDGMWKPSPGSIYPVLAQLEDEGLVEGRKEGSGRVFELTDSGRAHVEEHRDELGEPWKAVSGGFPKEGVELRALIPQLAAAAVQVMRAGDQEQRAKAVALLTEARRGLYRILAEDDPEG